MALLLTRPSRLLLLLCTALTALFATACASLPIERRPWIEVRSESFRFVSQLDAASTV